MGTVAAEIAFVAGLEAFAGVIAGALLAIFWVDRNVDRKVWVAQKVGSVFAVAAGLAAFLLLVPMTPHGNGLVATVGVAVEFVSFAAAYRLGFIGLIDLVR